MNSLLMTVEFIKNRATGKIHRVVRMSDTGQVLKDEQCNIDQIRESEVLATGALVEDEELCEHCFGDSAS